MDANFILSSRFIAFVRNYRRVVILLILLIGFGFSYPIGQSLHHPEVHKDLSSLPSFMTGVLSWELIIVLGLLMSAAFAIWWAPAILILRTLEKLLVSCREDSSRKFSERRELGTLKRLFTFQLILNVGVFFLNEISGSVTDLPEDVASTAVTTQDTATFSVLSHAQTYAEWVMCPFQKGMPLLYLLILFAIIQFSKQNEALRDEIAHTV